MAKRDGAAEERDDGAEAAAHIIARWRRLAERGEGGRHRGLRRRRRDRDAAARRGDAGALPAPPTTASSGSAPRPAWRLLGGAGGRRAASQGLVSLGIASAFANLVAKPLTTRRRPEREELEELARRHVPMPRTSSFPSGHTASAFAFATGAGHAAAGALGAAAGAGDAGRLFPRPYRRPLSRRCAGRRVHRRQRRRARPAACSAAAADVEGRLRHASIFPERMRSLD